MTTAEKLTTIAENQQRVYDAGYAKGKSEGGGGCVKTNIVVTKEPTCSEEGVATFTCAGCGAIGTEAIPTVDHVYDDGICTVCGAPDPYHINSYPVKDGLKGLYDLGGTEEDTQFNHANAAVPAALDGNYQISDEYATFTGKANSGRMGTNLTLTLSKTVTYVALFSVPDGGSCGNRVIVGCRYAGENTFNFGLSLLNDCMRFGADEAIRERKYPTAIKSDKFAILAMTANGNGCRVVRYTNGALSTPLAEYSGTIHSFPTNKTQIGGDSTSNNYDPANISLVAIHEGDITGGVEGVTVDDKLLEICRFVYDYGVQKHGEENIE